MRRLILFLIALLSPSLALAQSTTVSGNVTDLGGQVWSNGTVVATFVNPHGTGNSQFTWSGGLFIPGLAITASINGSGNYTMSVPSNTAIIPSNSQWTFTANSGTTGLSTQTITLTVTGGTQTVNFTPPALVITASSMSVAYSDSEVSAQTGQFYYNLTLTQPRVCQASTGAVCTLWAAMGSGGGGSGTVTHTIGPLTSGQLIFGNGTADIKVGDLTGDVTSAGTSNTTVSKIQTTPIAITSPATGQALSISGGSIINLFPGLPGRLVSITSDTVAVADRANTIQFTSGSATGETLPSAGSLGSNFVYSPFQTGSGLVTITPTSSTINGQSSIILAQNVWCNISSPDNANYLARCANWIRAGTNLTTVPNADGSVTLNASGGGSTPTLDAVLNPINNATFQFPATEQLAITGTQPASAGTGVNAATLFSVTTPTGGNGSSTTGGNGGSIVYNMGNGGTATSGIGGNGGDFIVNNGTGGTSTSGIRARSGSVSINCGADGSGGTGFGTGQGEAGCLQTSVTANQGTASFPMGIGVSGGTGGIWARNTASTSNNTVNNWSPVAGGMSAHMVLNGTATVTNGSPNVAQVTGAFFGMTLPGRTITIHGANYTILSITNNFNLVLTTNYTTDAGTTTQTFLEDAVVSAGWVLYSGLSGQSGMAQPVVANPDITALLQIPSLNNYTGTYHLQFMEGGVDIQAISGSGSIAGGMAIFSPGGEAIFGMGKVGGTSSTFTMLSSGVSSDVLGRVNINFVPSLTSSGGGGTFSESNMVAGMTDDGKNNGSWVHVKYLTNASGGTLADGVLVKMSGTNDQVTKFTTADTATPIVGAVSANGGANFTYSNGVSGAIAYAGVLNGVMTVDNASTRGDVLIPSNVNAGNLLSVTMPAPLPGSVWGISQKTVSAAATVDISLQPALGGPPYMSFQTGAYTNATTTASNIGGLSFPVLANFKYLAKCDLVYSGNVATAGLDITVTGPAAPTSILYAYDENPTTTSIQSDTANAFGTKIVGNTTITAAHNLHAIVTILLSNGANAGTVQVQGSATSTASSGVVTVTSSACAAWAK